MKRINKILFLFGSQEGEDRMLLTKLPPKGRYLDVGCSYPVKMSNTFMLYLNGWSGVCFDVIKNWKWWILRSRDKFVKEHITNISDYKDYDLLDLDVDGNDLQILQSMTFYPKWILAECSHDYQSGIEPYLTALDYKVVGMTSRNKLFERIK